MIMEKYNKVLKKRTEGIAVTKHLFPPTYLHEQILLNIYINNKAQKVGE